MTNGITTSDLFTKFFDSAQERRVVLKKAEALKSDDSVPAYILDEVATVKALSTEFMPLLNSLVQDPSITQGREKCFNTAFKIFLLYFDRITKLHDCISTGSTSQNRNRDYSIYHLNEIRIGLRNFVAYTLNKLSGQAWFIDNIKQMLNTCNARYSSFQPHHMHHEVREWLETGLMYREFTAAIRSATPSKPSTTTLIRAPR